MIRDLRTILDGWDYEPGKISCRKIIGRDGREKIQTRIDLGLLQIELTGRPDGRRPFGCASLLDYHEQRLEKHLAEHEDDDDFTLTPEQCRDLRHEAYLFYQRYLSLFVLEEFDDVEDDTERNLRLIEFCRQYAANPADRDALLPQRPYVMMMHVRARAYAGLQRGEYREALSCVDRGIREIRALVEDDDAPDRGTPAELEVLSRLRTEIFERMPADEPARIEWDLRAAIEREEYERAAALRDKLAAVRPALKQRSKASSK